MAQSERICSELVMVGKIGDWKEAGLFWLLSPGS
jgi:hypothetical protein